MAPQHRTRFAAGSTFAMGAILLTGCTGADHGTLSAREYDLAVAAAHQRLAKGHGETLTAAYAFLESSNAGLRNDGCPSRVIHVTLAGDFPHSIVLPSVGQSATITALSVYVDPTTGDTCEDAALNSPPLPAPTGSANLLPELD